MGASLLALAKSIYYKNFIQSFIFNAFSFFFFFLWTYICHFQEIFKLYWPL